MEICGPKYGHGKGKIIGFRNFLRKNEFIKISYNGNLPHWDQDGVLQFVTFRLNDSLPQIKLDEFRQIKEEWQEKHPKPWSIETMEEYQDLFEVIEDWLDKGYGDCVLKFEPVQRIIEETLDYYDGERYELFDYIIMPNHVHLLIIPGTAYTLEQLLHTIKGYSANKINKILNRKGKLWQKESFDRMIRNRDDYMVKKEYIKHNGDYMG